MMMNGDDELKVVPVRHVGRWISAGVAMVLAAMLVHTLFSKIPTGQYHCTSVTGHRVCTPVMEWRFSWDIVHQYFFSSEILHGLVLTILLTVYSMAIGIFLGVAVAVMRLSPNRLLSSTAFGYTWFFRGTPVLVQVLLWFNIASLYPQFSIGIPFTSLAIAHFSANSFVTPFNAGVLALSLNEGAYMSEIARAGLISVDEGQSEAASSIGMTRRQTLRYVVLPQAMRVIIPPTGNEIISMLKTSSLVSVIGVIELLGGAENIYAGNYEVVPLLIVASLWYLLVTSVLSIGQFYVERYFAKGALRTPPPTPWQRVKGDVTGILAKFRTRRVVRQATP